MNAGLDTGDILLSSKVKISNDMILPELREKLMTIGADLLIKTIYELEQGILTPTKQDDSLSNYAPMLNKETGRIDWKKSAGDIHNLVRGLYGGAYTFAGEEKFKIWRTKISEENFSVAPGEIKIVGEKIFVGTGEESLEILELQAPNAKKLDSANYLRGHKLTANKLQ